MSFTRYSTDDSVVSSETIVRGIWNGDNNTITTFATSSNQTTQTRYYYLDVYNNTSSTSSLQFDLQYGHISGSGSVNINTNVPNYTPSKVVYGQYRNLIYETEDTAILDASGTPIQDFYAINIARSRYKESLKPGSLSINLNSLVLTDNSQILNVAQFIGDNRYYDLVSGSIGTVVNSVVKYGYVFPDLGIILLNPASLSGFVSTPSRTPAGTDAQDTLKIYSAIVSGSGFTLQSQETVSSRYFFTRVKNGDYNYTTNPSIIDANGNLIYSTLIYNPQTYITTVGLYNDNNDLLAVAKLSKPLQKDFTQEALIRVKLSY